MNPATGLVKCLEPLRLRLDAELVWRQVAFRADPRDARIGMPELRGADQRADFLAILKRTARRHP